MSRRVLAVDWDCTEARAVVVERGPAGARITKTARVTLAHQEGQRAFDAVAIGRQLAQQLDSSGWKSGPITVCLGSDHVQFKLLDLPPAPAQELAELVRFQAQRDLVALSNGGELDYIPQRGDAQEPHRVLAAGCESSGLAEARAICLSLGGVTHRVTVRGCAAASLVSSRRDFDPQGTLLLLLPLANEADLIVLDRGKVALLRTVRLPPLDILTDESQSGGPTVGTTQREATLQREVRRTLGASQQQLGDRSVASLAILGTPHSAGGLRQSLEDAIQLPCVTIDPAEAAAERCGPRRSAAIDSPTPERFAAPIGAALDDVNDIRPVVDFLDARRPAETKRVERVHILAIAAACVIAISVAWLMFQRIHVPRREAARLQREIAELTALVEDFREVREQADAVRSWLDTDVRWVDELALLSQRVRPLPLDAADFAVAEDAVVTDLMLRPQLGDGAQGGRMEVSAVSRSAAAVAELESRLRDERRQVSGGRGQQDESVPGYGWQFRVDLAVPAADDSDQVTPAADKESTGDAATAATDNSVERVPDVAQQEATIQPPATDESAVVRENRPESAPSAEQEPATGQPPGGSR